MDEKTRCRIDELAHADNDQLVRKNAFCETQRNEPGQRTAREVTRMELGLESEGGKKEKEEKREVESSKQRKQKQTTMVLV